MNMSDDIASSVLQVSVKSMETAMHLSESVMDAIIRLLRFIEEQKRDKNAKTDVQNKEINDIKSGKVSTKDLLEHCRKNREKLVSSETGITKDDVSIYAAKAKKCGMPISFRNEKGRDNVYIGIRESDLPLFKQLQTEIIKEKLEVRPQELRNFKCKEWEIPFINAELKQHDLSAQFVKTTNGDYLAIYEAKDAKAIEIARSEFVRKASEVENSVIMSKDVDGFTIKDKLTGNAYQLDNNPNRKDIAQKLQIKLGYDENKANIAAQKFGHEMLLGDAKKKYFSDDPLTAFTYTSKVSWDNEDVLTKAYECFYVTPKEDSVSRIVYQDGEGKFAVLNPPRQTKATMRGILKDQLGITDLQEQNALIAKAEHISKVNAKYRSIKGNTEDLHSHEISFTREAFDMSNTEVVSNMRRTDENGSILTKKQPLDRCSTTIERNGADSFAVKSTAYAVEYDQNGEAHDISKEQNLVLSFSNKKTAQQELKEMYISQGVPESAAKEMARTVVKKAELQSAEKLIIVEQTKRATIRVSDINSMKELPAASRKEALEVMQEKYGVTAEEASTLYDKGIEEIQERVDRRVNEFKTDYTSAMNHDVNREKIKSDDMVLCSLSEPNKHIIVTSEHNDNRVIHNYELRNGEQTVGKFNDGKTQDADGNPIVENSNGRYAWTNLKNTMSEELGIDTNGENILMFSTEEEYHQYIDDVSFLNEASKTDVDTNINAENIVDTSINGNGHERHPEGNILDNPLLKEPERLSSAADKLTDKASEIADNFQESFTRGGR